MNNKTYYIPQYCRENDCHADYLEVYYCGDASLGSPDRDEGPAQRTQIYGDCNCLLNPPLGTQHVRKFWINFLSIRDIRANLQYSGVG